MLFREITADFCEKKSINTQWQNAQIMNVKTGGAYSNHCMLKSQINLQNSYLHHFVFCTGIHKTVFNLLKDSGYHMYPLLCSRKAQHFCSNVVLIGFSDSQNKQIISINNGTLLSSSCL